MAGKPLAKDRKTDIWIVDSRRLVVDEDFIEREDYGDIGALVRWIEANGILNLNPLKCYKRGEDYVIIRGHRRDKAIKIIASKTNEIVYVPIILAKKGESAERRYFEQASENEGKAYTPWEKAKVLKKARNLYGWDDNQMAKESGWSLVYVRKLLSLADAPVKFQDLVRSGRISATYAMDAIADNCVDKVLELADAGTLPAVPQNGELFSPAEEAPRPRKITKSVVRPNSVKIYKKWAPKVEREDIPKEKIPFFDFLDRLLKGELEEKDFKKFFK